MPTTTTPAIKTLEIGDSVPVMLKDGVKQVGVVVVQGAKQKSEPK